MDSVTACCWWSLVVAGARWCGNGMRRRAQSAVEGLQHLVVLGHSAQMLEGGGQAVRTVGEGWGVGSVRCGDGVP